MYTTLHYDFETCGIYVRGQPAEFDGHPNAVSLTAILDDENGITRAMFSTLVKPDGYILEDFPEAQAIHGIKTADAEKYGLPIDNVMRAFAGLAEHADVLSAFSHHFDHKFSKISCHRAGLPDVREMLETKQFICTMNAAAAHLKGVGQRFIKLDAAHLGLIGRPFDGAHQSLNDARATRRIFYKMKDLGVLPEPKPIPLGSNESA